MFPVEDTDDYHHSIRHYDDRSTLVHALQTVVEVTFKHGRDTQHSNGKPCSEQMLYYFNYRQIEHFRVYIGTHHIVWDDWMVSSLVAGKKHHPIYMQSLRWEDNDLL
jgi:hypothetical protein